MTANSSELLVVTPRSLLLARIGNKTNKLSSLSFSEVFHHGFRPRLDMQLLINRVKVRPNGA